MNLQLCLFYASFSPTILTLPPELQLTSNHKKMLELWADFFPQNCLYLTILTLELAIVSLHLTILQKKKKVWIVRCKKSWGKKI